MKKIIAFILSVAAFSAFAPLTPAYAAAVFNTHALDYPTIQVSNYTKNPGCTNCWETSVSADKGEVVTFLIYYHNNSNETARQTRLRAILPSGSATNHSIAGEVSADNAPTARGTAAVNLSSKQTLTFISGSVKWYPNKSTSPSPLPFSQNGTEVAGNGLNIGDVASGWSTQGYLTFRAQVSSTETVTTDQLPTIISYSSSAIGETYANLNAAINPNQSDTVAWFEYGTTQGLGNRTNDQFIGNSGTRSIIEPLSNLTPGTIYYFRVSATNARGTNYSPIGSFTTNNNQTNGGNQNNSGGAPSVFTYYATNINETFATLNGLVDANDADTNFWFEYGTSQTLGNQTPSRPLQSNIYRDVSELLPNLTEKNTYYFRIAAANSFGTTRGGTLQFTTSEKAGGLPIITNPFTTSVGGVFANLNATINPNGRETTVWFEYGTNGIPNQRSAEQVVGNGNSDRAVSIYAYNLIPNTVYSFRGVAQNEFGVNYTPVLTFLTTSQPPAIVAPIILPPAPPAPVIVPPAAATPIVAPVSAPAPIIIRQQMAITTTFSNTAPKVNEEIEYRILYRNRGNSAVRNAVLNVALPAEVTYQSADLVPASVENNGRIIRYALGAIAGNSENTILINVKINRSPENGDAVFVAALDYSLLSGAPESVKAVSQLTIDGDLGLAALLEFLGLPDWLLYFLLLVGIGLAIYYLFLKKERLQNNLL